jgi:cysteinyl-tRNA synthetase
VDDKLIDAAAKHKTTVQELAEKYTAEYLDCLSAIRHRIHRPLSQGVGAHARDHRDVPEADRRGFAYAAEGNVWFDVAKDADYGKLSNRKVEEQEADAHAGGTGQKNAADFASGKPPSPASRRGIRPGERAGPAGISNARP